MPDYHAPSIPKVAEFFGVDPDTIRKAWRARGMPTKGPNGYDLAAIAQWRIRYERDQAQPAAHDETRVQAAELSLASSALEVRIKNAAAERAERLEREAAGNVLDRAEYELATVEIITLTRDQLLSIPKLLCRLVPRKHHKKLRTEGDRQVRKALDDLANMLEAGPDE